ncbi:MAG TPA: hypothetical protein VKQ52_06690 [Puia sp.]|nr:hypothetical protein [Puia sp.]
MHQKKQKKKGRPRKAGRRWKSIYATLRDITGIIGALGTFVQALPYLGKLILELWRFFGL